jgi:hypothetical protein
MAQEEVRTGREGGDDAAAPRPRRLAVRRADGGLGEGNAGVEERAARDELAAAASAPEGVTSCAPEQPCSSSALRARACPALLLRGTAAPDALRCACSALERKAALYDHLQRGGGGADAGDADEPRYNVDFAMKARSACASRRSIALARARLHNTRGFALALRALAQAT